MFLLIIALNLNGYTLKEYNAQHDYTFGDVNVLPGEYVIVSRNADKASFESFWGITLGSNVVFVNSQGAIPQINGDETFSLYNSSGVMIDTTLFTMNSGESWYRESTGSNTWYSRASGEANPGSGASGGNDAGLVITEVSDASSYIYEFIELYYDAGDASPEFRDWSRMPYTPVAGQECMVMVRIVDNSAVLLDSLFYSIAYQSFDGVWHDSVKSDTFFYTIPPANGGDVVRYFGFAMDDSNNISYSDTFSYTVGDTSTSHYRILFDFTKEEDAGNADWVIDRDWPDPYPPDPSVESDWLGGISAWGFELHSAGWVVKTLPPESSITYGTSSPLDLSNFDVFVIPEPQKPFSSAEKQAIFNFVRNGGGLFMVADHNASDRNSNGWDSPRVFNDLGILDSFGMHLDTTGESPNSVSDTFTIIPDTNNTIIKNDFGVARGISFHLGDVARIETTYNSSAKGVILYGTNLAVVASCTFGNGRVVLIGDSSPCDDGTGSPGNTLYDGWNEFDDRIVFLNASLWLARGGTGVDINQDKKVKTCFITSRAFTFDNSINGKVAVYDATGRTIFKKSSVDRGEIVRFSRSGVYLLRINGEVRRLIVF